MLITTNQIVTPWGGVFGTKSWRLAAAIVYRHLHHNSTLMLQGQRSSG